MLKQTLQNPQVALPARDGNLVCRIATALAATGHPQLGGLQIAADDGTVTLLGCVNTYYQKQMAQSTAMNLDGVECLQNEIVVI